MPTSDEKIAEYNASVKEILSFLNKAEEVAQKESRGCNEDYITHQKQKIASKKQVQSTHEWKTALKVLRHRLEEIEDGYQKEMLEKSVEDSSILNQVLLQLSQLKEVKGEVAKHVPVSRPQIVVRKQETEEKPRMKVMKADKSEGVDLVSSGIEQLAPEGSRPVKRQKRSLETMIPIPAPCPESRVLPDIEFKENHLQLLKDGQKCESILSSEELLTDIFVAVDDELMEIAVRDALAKYDANESIAHRRSYSILPDAIFKYFLDEKYRDKIASHEVDIFSYVRSTYDVFSLSDLYITVHIEGHQHTAVVRNVVMCLDRIRKTISGCNVFNDNKPRSRRSVDKLREELEKDCVLIIFDSDYNEEKHKHIHEAILQAVKEYLLAEAQYFYGCHVFQSDADIDVQLHTAAVPSQVGRRALNNCGPFSIKYLTLYLEDTERCCPDVIPLGKSDDQFWQPHRILQFRNDVRLAICPHYRNLGAKEGSNDQSSDAATVVEDFEAATTPIQSIGTEEHPAKRVRIET